MESFYFWSRGGADLFPILLCKKSILKAFRKEKGDESKLEKFRLLGQLNAQHCARTGKKRGTAQKGKIKSVNLSSLVLVWT